MTPRIVHTTNPIRAFRWYTHAHDGRPSVYGRSGWWCSHRSRLAAYLHVFLVRLRKETDS